MSDMIDCPQCGLPAQKDDYYVVGEERVVCDYCGYSHIKADGDKEVSPGYGSVHYVHVNESDSSSKRETELIRFKTPLDLKARHDAIMKIYGECDPNRSSLFVWNENLNELECLHGSKPRTLDQQYQDAMEEHDYYNQIMANSGIKSIECTDYNED
jgi:rubredoxin